MNEEMHRAFVAKLEATYADSPAPPTQDELVAFTTDIGREEGIIRDFGGKRWQEISLDTMFEWRMGIHSMTAKGFRYYLPAFMRAIMLHSEKTVDLLPDTVVTRLEPPDPAKLDKLGVAKKSRLARFQQFADSFSPQELAVIVEFLKLYLRADYLYERYAARYERIIDYWKSVSA